MSAPRLVILAVAGALLLSVLLIGLLALRGQAVPDVMQNIAVGSLTGLVGLLVPRPGAGDQGEDEN